MIGTTLNGKELAMPLGLMLVVGCMILPLPPMILDILLVSNLLFALLLVIGALHINDPLKIAALPSLLLMATLFRLSLNLATTRAVLSSGHAGQAVEAFGSVVIQGNVVVGFVLFLLITMVQFVVVAKGAERVAEVAARFTLDALPGKQMAIDAEIRSGVLDPETARKKRAEVQTESRFYGALDGSMKFVKGDAIAGLIIVFVNICGGLLVGLALQGLDIDVAMHKYTVLTIGDGLLSQIPSLLNSVAAGLVVTRVQVDESSTLASDVLSQIAQFKAARGFVAIASCVLGFLPGMPHFALLALGIIMGLSLVLSRSTDVNQKAPPIQTFEPSLAQTVQIEINQRKVGQLPPLAELSDALEKLRGTVFSRWGIVLERPGMSLLKDSEDDYRILIRGMDVFSRPPDDNDQLIWQKVESDFLEMVDNFRLELIDDAITRRALDYVEKQAPDLVSSVVPNTLTITQCTSLLRSLLKERVTIRHLDVILQNIAESGGKLSDRSLLAAVRVALRQVISRNVATGKKVQGVVLDPLLDLMLAKAEEEESLISPELLDLICSQLVPHDAGKVVVIASKRSRAYLRDLLQSKGIKIPVIAHEEVSPGFEVEAIDFIEVKDELERASMVEALVA